MGAITAATAINIKMKMRKADIDCTARRNVGHSDECMRRPITELSGSASEVSIRPWDISESKLFLKHA